jgi:hypothetical protein
MSRKAGVKLIEFEMWRYRYLVLFSVGVVLAILILSNNAITSFLSRASEWSYFGAFATGIFYTYSLTSMPATAVFFEVSKGLNPFVAAALGGLGAMLGDLIIFKFIKTDILPEARLLARDLRIPRIRSRKFIHMIHKVAPFIAGFIIASPLPDELGAAMFGAIEYDTKKFMVISWTCNTLGLLAIALLGKVF